MMIPANFRYEDLIPNQTAALFFITIIIPTGKVFSKLGLYLLHIQKNRKEK